MADVFIEGVDRDGLKNISDIKILICYLLSTVSEPLTRTGLNDILQGDYTLANYFEVNEALSELIKSNKVKIKEFDGDEYLSLGNISPETIILEQRRLPRSVREKAINCAVKLFTKNRRKRENEIKVEKLEKGYNVTFSLFDVNTEFMKLTIYVSDSYQVEKIKENFLKNPSSLYSGIIANLTD